MRAEALLHNQAEAGTTTIPARPRQVAFLADHVGHRHGNIHGVTTYFLETLPAFDRARVEPTLYVLRPRHPVAERFEAAGVPIRFFGRAKSDPRALVDVLGLLNRQSIDVLHLCGLKALLLGRVAARLKGCPVVAHFHDTIRGPKWMRSAQRRLSPSTSAAIAVSHPVRNWAIEEFALRPEIVEVIHNGHIIDRYAMPAEGARQMIRAELGLGERPVIGVIGRIDRNKGQAIMIRAMPRLLERCPGAVLLVVGDGPERGACEALVRTERLPEAVHFTGQRQDVPELLAAMDVIALSSLSEGLSYVAMEAAAAGRPVVAFRTGGIPEVVAHETTGLLVPPGDVAGMVSSLARVLEEPGLRRRLGEQGRARAAQFTVARHVHHLEALYGSVHLDAATRGTP